MCNFFYKNKKAHNPPALIFFTGGLRRKYNYASYLAIYLSYIHFFEFRYISLFLLKLKVKLIILIIVYHDYAYHI